MTWLLKYIISCSSNCSIPSSESFQIFVISTVVTPTALGARLTQGIPARSRRIEEEEEEEEDDYQDQAQRTPGG